MRTIFLIHPLTCFGLLFIVDVLFSKAYKVTANQGERYLYRCCLQDHIDQDDKERVGETEEEPDLYGFNVGSAGEAGGD